MLLPIKLASRLGVDGRLVLSRSLAPLSVFRMFNNVEDFFFISTGDNSSYNLYYFNVFFLLFPIGGGENIAKMTHGKFNTGFRGCIKNTFFKDRGMDLQGDAIRGWNVLPCDSDEAEP